MIPSTSAAPMRQPTLTILVTPVVFFGQRVMCICDGRCDKAWGISHRPHVQLGSHVDDTAMLADQELGEAPVDPGTYEGDHGKPTDKQHNKWCVRECERSRLETDVELTLPRDFSVRQHPPVILG